MVVEFLHKTDAGSNKPEKYAVQLTSSAYWYTRPSGFKVTILKPKIDRISITCPVGSVGDQEVIRKKLKALAEDIDTPGLTKWQKMKGWGAGKYARSYGLSVGKGTQVLIQCTAGKTDTAFLRFEFNPDHIGSKGVAVFKETLPEITGGIVSYGDLAKTGRVTRVDVAVDLINVDIEDLLIGVKKPGKKMSYFGIGGKIETAYQNTTRTIYIYDKRQKQIDDGVAPKYGSTPHTRVEIRTSTTKSILQLPKLMNHLKKVSLIDIEAPDPPEEPHHWNQFQDACRYRGLDGALNQLPDDVRAKYEEAIDAVSGELWRPDKLWSHWPETVQKSGLLEP